MADVPSSPPATARWQKSRATATQNCLEVTRAYGYVWVRDSKDPLGPALRFTRGQWEVFLVGVQHDEFDRSVVAAC